MSLFDDLKYKREANQEFKEQVALVKSDIARHAAAELQAKQKLDKLVALQRTGKVDEQYFHGWNPAYLESLQAKPDMLEKVIFDAKQDYMRWQQAKYKAEKELSFMRHNTKEDITERRAAFVNFAKEVLVVDPEGKLDLRFHSTTLSATKDIIQSGGLISSVDRTDGFLETTNYSNEISVSEIQNIQYSIDYWTDIEGYNGCRPCGCMFVLQPASQEEANMIHSRQMHNVYFQEHPEQLVGIVTTSENIERLQLWLQEKGLPKDIVCKFDAFANVLEGKKDSLAPTYKKVREVELVGATQVSSVDALISGAQARSYNSFSGKSNDFMREL